MRQPANDRWRWGISRRSPVHCAKYDVERAGFTPIAFALGLRRLQKKGFIEQFEVEDQDGDYEAVKVTADGWQWLDRNEDKFIMRSSPATDELPY